MDARTVERSTRHTKRRSRRLALLFVAFVIAGGLIWLRVHKGQPNPNNTRASEAPVTVHTGVAAKQDFPVYLQGLGNVQAWNSVAVRSRVDGQVEKIAFREGDLVKQGDVLVQLDARPFKAALDQATAKVAQDEANQRSAQADLARTTALVGRGYATKQLFDQQTAAVNQLAAAIEADKAAVENAKVSLDYTTITAPISGRIGLRSIDIGNIVHTTDLNPIVTITETQPIAVIFTAPEDQLAAIVAGFKAGPVDVAAFTPDGKAQLADGKLWSINNEVDAVSGTIRLKGRFENFDDALWPGLSVSTQLLVKSLHDAIVIPEPAVQHGPDGLFAYVVRADKTVDKRDLKIGPTAHGEAVVEAGLEPGEQVVTSGQYRLRPGAPVITADEGEQRTATGAQ